jgi:hypothetical protein
MIALGRLFGNLIGKLIDPAQNDSPILRALKLLMAALVLCVVVVIAYLRVNHNLNLGPN